MTTMQFSSMVQARNVGDIAVTGKPYSDSKPSADAGKYAQIPSCAAVAAFLGEHLEREFRGTGAPNERVEAELYDTPESARAVDGLLQACDKASRPCHFEVDKTMSESGAEIRLLRTRSSIEGVDDDTCVQVLGNQVQVQISNVLFLATRPGQSDEQFARAYAAAAAKEFTSAHR